MGYNHLVRAIGSNVAVVDACVEMCVYKNLIKRGIHGIYSSRVMPPGASDKAVAGLVPDNGILLTQDVEFYTWFTRKGKNAILLTGSHHKRRGCPKTLSKRRATRIRKRLRLGFERMFGGVENGTIN